MGENIDQGGSSGSGKSTIITAISYVLFDKTLNQVGKERLINRTNQVKNTQMEAYIKLKRGADEYLIKRYRGESYGAQIIKNGEDVTPDSVSNINKKIEEIIGISFELFSRIVVFNGNDRPFLDLSINEQRNQIEELFKITSLSNKASVLKDQIREVESEVKVQEAITKQQEAQIDLHKKHLRDAAGRIESWEKDNAAKIEKIKKDLQSIENIDVEKEQELIETANKIQDDLSVLESEMSKTERKIATLEKTTNSLLGERHHLTDSKCPYCLQAFEDAGKKIVDIDEKIHDAGEEIEALRKQYTVFIEEAKTLSEQLETVSANITVKNINQLLKIANNKESLQRDINRLQSEVNPHIDAYKSLEAEKIEKVDYTLVDELKQLVEHQKFLHKLLTDKNSFIRKKIINKTIPFLNKQLSVYLGGLNLQHVVKFKADMSCEITEYGRELDFGNLSNGEKKRLNLALSLAFRDVLFHLHGPINILFADEVDGGSFDSNIVDMSIRLFKDKSQEDACSIYVISHRPEFDGKLDQTITVCKENGFSNIV